MKLGSGRAATRSWKGADDPKPDLNAIAILGFIIPTRKTGSYTYGFKRNGLKKAMLLPICQSKMLV